MLFLFTLKKKAKGVRFHCSAGWLSQIGERSLSLSGLYPVRTIIQERSLSGLGLFVFQSQAIHVHIETT